MFNEDPEFVSMHTQSIVLEDLMRLAEARGLSGPTDFGEAIGKSRQYAQQILNQKKSTNFSIDTLAKFAGALNGKLVVRIVDKNEHAPVLSAEEWEMVKRFRFGNIEPATRNQAVLESEPVPARARLKRSSAALSRKSGKADARKKI